MPSRALLEQYERTLDLEAGTLVTRSVGMSSIANKTSPNTFRLPDISAIHSESQSIPQDLRLIQSHEACRELIISLLITAPKNPSEQAREICLMMPDPQKELSDRWFQALALALDKGYNITHIWSPPSSADDLTFIETMLSLMIRSSVHAPEKGKYTVFYLPNTFPASAPYELFVSPDQGAVQLFGKFQSAYADSAIFYPLEKTEGSACTHRSYREYVQHFRSYFAMLRVKAEPLIQTYPVSWSAAFDWAILEAELRDGEECLLVSPLSDKTMPAAVRLARMQRILNDKLVDPRAEDWLREEYSVVVKRRERFEQQRVLRWPVRHVLYREAINRMIKDNRFRDSKDFPFKNAKLEPEEIRSCIGQLISDLQKFKNYEVALSNEPLPEGDQTYWEIVGDTGLFVAADASKPLLHVALKHAMVIAQVKSFFMHQWENFSPEEKDKKQVISYLTTCLEEL